MSSNIIPFRSNLLESSVDDTFKMTIDTAQAGSASDTFVLPLQSTVNNFVVNWGDGSSETVTTVTSVSHTYASSGTYQITLSGSFGGIYFINGGDKLKVSSIDNWGANQWTVFGFCFYGCSNMVANYTDAPDTSLVSDFQNSLRGCTNFNGEVDFDTSSATTMNSMFQNCDAFNQPINFNAPLLANTSSMLRGCTNFNSTVNLTTTSLLTNTVRMFQQCTNFNSAITISDTSGVTDMSIMFYLCSAFDQDVSAFQINSLTNAASMFLLSGFTQSKYDLLLPAWDSYGTSGVTFHAGTAQYSAATSAPATARALMAGRGWTITDGGPI